MRKYDISTLSPGRMAEKISRAMGGNDADADLPLFLSYGAFRIGW
jgi:hypothetical protein